MTHTTDPAPLHLVACVSQKVDRPAPAAQLYRSDWFNKARAYVEARRVPWLILSAEHGLLDPGQVVAPYDRTLLDMTRAERAAWAAMVRQQLTDRLGAPCPLTFLAGRLYRDGVTSWATHAAVPMAGLGIGSQKGWLAARLRELVA